VCAKCHEGSSASFASYVTTAKSAQVGALKFFRCCSMSSGLWWRSPGNVSGLLPHTPVGDSRIYADEEKKKKEDVDERGEQNSN